jgi:hypothetical protein
MLKIRKRGDFVDAESQDFDICKVFDNRNLHDRGEEVRADI